MLTIIFSLHRQQPENVTFRVETSTTSDDVTIKAHAVTLNNSNTSIVTSQKKYNKLDPRKLNLTLDLFSSKKKKSSSSSKNSSSLSPRLLIHIFLWTFIILIVLLLTFFINMFFLIDYFQRNLLKSKSC